MDKDLDTPFIFESPDNGDTVYQRRFGCHDGKHKLVKNENVMKDKKWEKIQEHCRKLSADMLRWDEEDRNWSETTPYEE